MYFSSYNTDIFISFPVCSRSGGTAQHMSHLLCYKMVTKNPTTIICIVFLKKKLVMTSKSKMLQIKTKKKTSPNYMKKWGRTCVVLYVISIAMLKLCWVSNVMWFHFCFQITLWEVNSEFQFVHLGWYVW